MRPSDPTPRERALAQLRASVFRSFVGFEAKLREHIRPQGPWKQHARLLGWTAWKLSEDIIAHATDAEVDRVLEDPGLGGEGGRK